MTTKNTNDDIDGGELLDTLVIARTTYRQLGAGGTWVEGTIAGHRFQVLIYPDPARNREWEVGGDSRISKL